MSSLKILMPVFTQSGKGTYWRTFGLAQELATRGHEVTVIAAGQAAQEGTEITRSGHLTLVKTPGRFSATQGTGYDPGEILSRIRWLRGNRARIDVVHFFESRPTSWIPAVIGRRWGATVVSDWCDWFGRGGSVEQRPNLVLRAVLRPVETVLENRSRPWANGVTVINNVLYQKARALGVPAERILLLQNGAYTDDFRPSDRLAARRRLGLPLQSPLIAYTGTLFSSDAELMVAAFDKLKTAGTDAKLLLIGYTNLDLRSLVRHPEDVISTGPVSFQELVDYVAASTIGWVPLADNEANAGRFPMKINDFMASGRAIVVTDVGDLGDAVRQHEIGLVANPEPDSVAEQTAQLLANEALRQRIEERARHVAETVFAWPKVTDLLEQFYLRLLVGGR